MKNHTVKLLLVIVFFLPITTHAQYVFDYDDSGLKVIELTSGDIVNRFSFPQYKHKPRIKDQNGHCFVGSYDSVNETDNYGMYDYIGHSKFCCYDINGKMLMEDIEAIDVVLPQNNEIKMVIYLQGDIADAGPVVFKGIGVFNLYTGENSSYTFESPVYVDPNIYSWRFLNYNLSDNHIYLSMGKQMFRFDPLNLLAGYEEVEGGLIYSDDNKYSANIDTGKIYKNGELYDYVKWIVVEDANSTGWIKGTNYLFCPDYIYDAENKKLTQCNIHSRCEILYYDRTTNLVYTRDKQIVNIEKFISDIKIPTDN